MPRMQIGKAGRYDDEAARLLRVTDAKAVAVIVVDGRLGSGMSVSSGAQHVDVAYGGTLASKLRALADALERGSQPGGFRVAPKNEG
jgi:hypothetical protein